MILWVYILENITVLFLTLRPLITILSPFLSFTGTIRVAVTYQRHTYYCTCVLLFIESVKILFLTTIDVGSYYYFVLKSTTPKAGLLRPRTRSLERPPVLTTRV